MRGLNPQDTGQAGGGEGDHITNAHSTKPCLPSVVLRTSLLCLLIQPAPFLHDFSKEIKNVFGFGVGLLKAVP